MLLSSSSPQWLCGNMPTMDGQWQSSRISSVRINRLLKKHQTSSANILIKTSWFITKIVLNKDKAMNIILYTIYYIRTHLYIHTYTSTYVHVYTYICIYMYVCIIYIYIYIYIHIYIYIYIHINTNTHIHPYKHI